MNICPNKNDFRGNLFRQMLFLWVDKLFLRGFTKKLVHEDLNPCPSEQCSEELYEKFNKYWQMELKKKGKPDLKLALARTVKTTLLTAGLFLLLEGFLVILQAVFINLLSSECTQKYANTTGTSHFIGPSIGYSLIISLISLWNILNINIGYFLVYTVAMQIRSICVSALFRKVLRLQQAVLHKISIGHIINLASNDVYKFDFGILYWNYIWIAPIITVLSTVVMVVYLGPIGLITVSIVALHSPLQTMLGLLFGHFRYRQSVTADTRIRLMDQVIRGMLVIKFYVWEKPFVRYIGKIRRKESIYANLSGYIQSFNQSFSHTSMFISLFVTYTVSIALKEPISTSQLGLAFFVLNVLRYNTVICYAQGVFSLRESTIAINRIQRVLQLPENIDNQITMLPFTSTEYPIIQFDNLSASWKGTDHSNDLVLESIQLTIEFNQLVAIAGPVGSGKSSLLLSLINELPGMSGHLTVTGATSYASQEPWIFSGSIRDNILFGNPLDPKRYWEVIDACSLTEEVNLYTDRDMTLIGERGVTLSGGQKARVSLARSVYHHADIYLFDDPLSAVDTRVGRELFDRCMRVLLRDKLVLLVTHHIHYVRQADYIIVMRKGKIVSSGTYQEVVNKNLFSRKFLHGLEKSDEQRKIDLIRSVNENHSQLYNQALKISVAPSIVLNSSHSETSIDVELNPTQPLSTALTTEDYRPNSINTVTYFHYFWAGGLMATIILLLFTLLTNVALLLAYWWMQTMAKCTHEIDKYLLNVSFVIEETIVTACPWYFRHYDTSALQLIALFTFSGSFMMFLRGINFYYVVLQASRRLHNRMLHRILHAPIRFFDTNPSGRILNRFSKDIGFLDEQLPQIFYEFWVLGSFGAAILVASCIVQYLLIIPILLLIIVTLGLRYYFLKTSTQIKRIESIARSPLYSHISLTLQGLSTIRALRIEDRVIRDLHYFQDEHSRTWYHHLACQRWFGIRIDILTVLLIIFSLFSASISRCVFESGELISFTIPLLLTLPSILQYVIRLSGDIDILMVSTDRILKYCNLQQEKSYHTSSVLNQYGSIAKQSANTCGIKYKNVYYNHSKELPYSLVDVSLNVLPGEKIGIIGRTGAGKSSLLNSLFLMNEISAGSISVGGEDISSLNLYEHRKRLSIIPQEPFLFSGTLRYNLDPFEEFTCGEIWDALEKSHLKSLVENLPDQLLAVVNDDGHNFSTGERQLLCLARALLRRNQIIVIDEATANVDMQTDLLVQQAIKTNFSNCTVLTIAHRIETIIDSDRIVVLDKATIVEADIPFLLLLDKDSYFNKFMSHLDSFTQEYLRDAAEENYFNFQKNTSHFITDS